MELFPRQGNPNLLAPPGVVPNYVNPDSIGIRMVVALPLLASLAFVFVVMRFSIRLSVVKRLMWDDLLIFIALLLAIARATLGVIMVKKFQTGRHVWDIDPALQPGIGNNNKNYLFISDMLYFVAIMLTKIAILMLYVNLFGVQRWFRYLCYGMMAFVFSYLTIFFFIWAFDCNPVAKNWNLIGWTGREGFCIDIIKTNFAVGAINIFTDTVILIMPIPLLKKLHLSRGRKFGVIGIFATGIFVVVCTIVREVITVRDLRDVDQTQSTVSPFIWLTAELCVGIICACLPTLAPLFTRKVLGSFKLIPDSLHAYLISISNKFTSSSGSSNKSDVERKSSGSTNHTASQDFPVMSIMKTREHSVHSSREVGSLSSHTDVESRASVAVPTNDAYDATAPRTWNPPQAWSAPPSGKP